MSSFRKDFLEGRIALVTGGSRGIGREIAICLARYGAYIYINYNNSEKFANEVKKEIEKHNGKCELIKFDVANHEEVKNSFKTIAKKFNKLDILVNNAGVAKSSLAIKFKEEEYNSMFDSNVKGHFNCIKFALPLLIRSGAGSIINMSSVLAFSGDVGNSIYSASKGAIISLTKSLALEYASKNVRSNCIAPGFIKTDMTSNLSEEVSKMVLSKIPLGYQADPIEIANCVLFLVSDEAKYITGQTIAVDGGMTMR